MNFENILLVIIFSLLLIGGLTMIYSLLTDNSYKNQYRDSQISPSDNDIESNE